jgi:predicted phosphate transport protein (TIGR00153 family)
VVLSLGNLFAKSPISPIQQHMEKVHSCAALLTDFMQSVLEDDWQRAAKVQGEITGLEGEADTIKRSIRMHLPKSLFMPVPRSDLLSLVTMQDKVANTARDIAGIMLGRQMSIPVPLQPLFVEYVQTAIATSAQALAAIEELDELLETGFSGREVDAVQVLINELDELEHQTDKIQVRVRAALFAIEQDLPPVNVIFLYRVIDAIGELADYAERVGSRLEVLLAR